MGEGTINYLGWHLEEDHHGPASELFHDLHGFSRDTPELTVTEFDDLYQEVRTLEDAPDDPEEVWKQWNRGSGYESPEFLDTRYCESCESYIEGSDEAITHAVQNHGYDAFDETGEPDYVHGVRSMSVGDVIEQDGDYQIAMSVGFEDLELSDGGGE